MKTFNYLVSGNPVWILKDSGELYTSCVRGILVEHMLTISGPKGDNIYIIINEPWESRCRVLPGILYCDPEVLLRDINSSPEIYPESIVMEALKLCMIS